MNRIRRRYRKRHGRYADWAGYVAGLLGVNPQTVGEWRVGTMRPSPDRLKMLRIVYEEFRREYSSCLR